LKTLLNQTGLVKAGELAHTSLIAFNFSFSGF